MFSFVDFLYNCHHRPTIKSAESKAFLVITPEKLFIKRITTNQGMTRTAREPHMYASRTYILYRLELPGPGSGSFPWMNRTRNALWSVGHATEGGREGQMRVRVNYEWNGIHRYAG